MDAAALTFIYLPACFMRSSVVKISATSVGTAAQLVILLAAAQISSPERRLWRRLGGGKAAELMLAVAAPTWRPFLGNELILPHRLGALYASVRVVTWP